MPQIVCCCRCSHTPWHAICYWFFRFEAPKRWFKRTVFGMWYENMIGLRALALVCTFWIRDNTHIDTLTKTHIETRKRLNNNRVMCV